MSAASGKGTTDRAHTRRRSTRQIARDAGGFACVKRRGYPRRRPLQTTIPARAGPKPAAGSQSLSLFLANLRLLDLDLLPDWPEITVHTFAGKDATQGQKKRIICVEWALYQLFAIWDPEETRQVGQQSCAEFLLGRTNPRLTASVEARALLSSCRSGPVPEPTRRSAPLLGPAEEGWRARTRCGCSKDYARRMQG